MRYNHLKIGTDDVGSNQWWRRLNLGSTIEPTTSLPIFKRLYDIIYKTLAVFFFCAAERMLRTIIMQIFRLIQAFFLAKSSRFKSADFASVMTDDVGCSGCHQCTQILGVWPFWLTPLFFRSITFWRAYGLIVFPLLKLLSFFWLTYYCSIGLCFSVRV